MVHAATFGHVDFGSCDGTAKWWLGARMRLAAVEQELQLRTIELHAHRSIAVQAMLDLSKDVDYRQRYAIDAVERYQHESMPWYGAAKTQNDHNAALDDIAAWYAVFGEKLGVL